MLSRYDFQPIKSMIAEDHRIRVWAESINLKIRLSAEPLLNFDHLILDLKKPWSSWLTEISEFWNWTPYQSGQETPIDQVGLYQYQYCNITQLYTSVYGSSSIQSVSFDFIRAVKLKVTFFKNLISA